MAKSNSELKEMDLADLVEELRATKHEALNLRFRNATGQLDNNAEISKVRRPVSYTHLRAHETVLDLVCRLLLEKKNAY